MCVCVCVCVCVCLCVCVCVCVCVITDDTLILNWMLLTAASLLSDRFHGSAILRQTRNPESRCHGDSRISDFIWGDNLWCAPFLSDFLQLFLLSGFRKHVSIWVSIATGDIMGCVYMIHLVQTQVCWVWTKQTTATRAISIQNTETQLQYVTLEHKTSHNDTFYEIEMYASSESWINHISIDVWFGQYL